MNSIQHILNAFRENYTEYGSGNKWVANPKQVEDFILNTLTEFEREIREKIEGMRKEIGRDISPHEGGMDTRERFGFNKALDVVEKNIKKLFG